MSALFSLLVAVARFVANHEREHLIDSVGSPGILVLLLPVFSGKIVVLVDQLSCAIGDEIKHCTFPFFVTRRYSTHSSGAQFRSFDVSLILCNLELWASGGLKGIWEHFETFTSLF